MASSSRAREVEHRSASACTYASSEVVVSDDEGWRLVDSCSSSSSSDDDDDPDGAILADCAAAMADYAGGDSSVLEGFEVNNNNGEKKKKKNVVKCQALAPGTSIRVAPMERACGGWSEEHFHEQLRLPAGSPPSGGLVVLFESMARECIAIALSPRPCYELGKTYVVHIGANGNLETVLRRHVNYQDCVDASFPSRACCPEDDDAAAWVPYWVALRGGKLSVGVGRVPGRHAIGTLDDGMYDMLRSGVDAARYVGVGNSALRRNARDLRVRNVVVAPVPPGWTMPSEGEGGGGFVNVLDMGYGGRGVGGDNPSSGGGGGAGFPTDAELLAEYEKERAKARARSEKFGVPYREPPPDAFLKWSEARRLRANPERGFVTGIDTFSAEEKAKADARKERFRRDERKRKGLDPDGDEDDVDTGRRVKAEGSDGEEAMEDDDDDEDRAEDDVAEWEKTKADPLPVEQAWENWRLVEQFRVDPPPGLLSGDADGAGETTDEFVPRRVVPVPNKVHIFSIDWAPFKQVRTDDLLSYFRDYGPSYVEWLGELSCNVHFGDAHSARRALVAMSRVLPSPPPPGAAATTTRAEGAVGRDIGARWEAPPTAGDAVDEDGAAKMEDTDNDDAGVKSDKDAADNAEEVGATEKEAMDDGGGEGGDVAVKKEDISHPPDLGGMGWRFCKWTVRKVSNDRFGRRGTRARVLMRMATSLDVLDDRPTEWPKPPPGFTTKSVLMPWHDFSGRRQQQRRGGGGGGGRRDTKRRRRRGGDGRGRRGSGGRDEEHEEFESGNREHPGLTKGLRSGRSGFSVEELQAERNAKNAEILSME